MLNKSFNFFLGMVLRCTNISQMSKRCDITNFDDKMDEFIKSFNLRKFINILMHSPPGCGKTHLVRLIIQMFQEYYDYLWIDGSDKMSAYYGDTQKKISSIFEAARKHYRPVILFCDETDGLFGEHKNSRSNLFIHYLIRKQRSHFFACLRIRKI